MVMNRLREFSSVQLFRHSSRELCVSSSMTAKSLTTRGHLLEIKTCMMSMLRFADICVTSLRKLLLEFVVTIFIMMAAVLLLWSRRDSNPYLFLTILVEMCSILRRVLRKFLLNTDILNSDFRPFRPMVSNFFRRDGVRLHSSSPYVSVGTARELNNCFMVCGWQNLTPSRISVLITDQNLETRSSIFSSSIVKMLRFRFQRTPKCLRLWDGLILYPFITNVLQKGSLSLDMQNSVLSALKLIQFFLVVVETVLIRSFSPFSVVLMSIMSSAYISMPVYWPCRVVPLSVIFSSISVNSSSVYILYRCGDNTEPCRTPWDNLNSLEYVLLYLTFAVEFMYSDLMTFTIDRGIFFS